MEESAWSALRGSLDRKNDMRTCVLWKQAKSVGCKKVSPGLEGLEAMNGSVTCSAMHLHMSAKAGGPGA